jgi:extracellular elastinolytic metalloproteinase
LILPGDDVDVVLTVTNHRPEDLTSVVVTDELPDGLTIDEASASIPATVSGNTVSFEIGDMAYLDEVVITYILKSDPDVFSQRFYLEDLEDNSTVFNEWTASNSEGLTGGWELTTELAYSGAQSFKAADDGTVELKSELTSLVQHEIQGDRPVLRMYHYFNTVTAVNGGYIELSTDQGNTWQRVQDSWIKNGYNTGLSYTTFTVPFLEGFSGNSTNFIGSYLDLSDYIGETISMRFRYGAAAGSASPVGWVVDDIELMDLITYNGEACVSSDQSETACASAAGEGTLVDSDISTNTKDAKNGLTFNVFPNPASDAINIQLNDQDASTINIELFDATGKLIQSVSKANYGNSITTIPTADLAKGVYIVKVISNGFAGTQKVILN